MKNLTAAILLISCVGHVSALETNLATSFRLYWEQYAVQTPPIGWTGDYERCDSGDTSPAFKDAVLQRINYYRAMAGVPADVVLLNELNERAQSAAMMMSVNRALSHSPPETWECYSEAGADGAGHSNLARGVNGLDAIDLYMKDPGDNYSVGHRRWILYSRSYSMGTGDIPSGDGFPATNALWVVGEWEYLRPSTTRDGFVAWPPPGYVPLSLAYPRWSFSYPGADFASATVSMTGAGSELIRIESQPIEDGYGDNTIVWEPSVRRIRAGDEFSVSIANVMVGGVNRQFSYSVTLFDPAMDLPLAAGDANQDLAFDQLDIVNVLMAGKYLSGQPATWGDGDWNGAPGGKPGTPPRGDGVFDQKDIVAALATGHYLHGAYTAIVRPVPEQDSSIICAMIALHLCVGIGRLRWIEKRGQP